VKLVGRRLTEHISFLAAYYRTDEGQQLWLLLIVLWHHMTFAVQMYPRKMCISNFLVTDFN